MLSSGSSAGMGLSTQKTCPEEAQGLVKEIGMDRCHGIQWSVGHFWGQRGPGQLREAGKALRIGNKQSILGGRSSRCKSSGHSRRGVFQRHTAMLGGLPWMWVAGGWHGKNSLGKEMDIGRLPCKGVGKNQPRSLALLWGTGFPCSDRYLGARACTGTCAPHPGPGNQGSLAL